MNKVAIIKLVGAGHSVVSAEAVRITSRFKNGVEIARAGNRLMVNGRPSSYITITREGK